jgi:hypothetical protein
MEEPVALPQPAPPAETPSEPLPQSPVTSAIVDCSAVPTPATCSSIQLTKSDAEIPNPERGFYNSVEDFPKTSLASLKALYASGTRVVRGLIALDDFRGQPLPAAFLAQIEAGFDNLRKAGLKVNLRFTYNGKTKLTETDYKGAKDAPLDITLNHIKQLGVLLEKNKDVLFTLDAGFVGAWGEWHSSSNGNDTPEKKAIVRDAILKALPSNRTVMFRYPVDMEKWFPSATGSVSNQKVGANKNFGLNNDCFMSSQNDVGTYGRTSTDRRYAQALTKTGGAFGGETCDPADEKGAKMRDTCADIRKEGATYGLSYLNSEYNTAFMKKWTREGCMAEVKRKMGYRIDVQSAVHSNQAQSGKNFSLALTLANDGWAKPINPRPIRLTMKNRATGKTIETMVRGVDLAQHLKAGKTIQVKGLIKIPPNTPAGQYDISVSFPDPLLSGDSRYSVRPANADNPAKGQKWNPDTATMSLGTSIQISSPTLGIGPS